MHWSLSNAFAVCATSISKLPLDHRMLMMVIALLFHVEFHGLVETQRIAVRDHLHGRLFPSDLSSTHSFTRHLQVGVETRVQVISRQKLNSNREKIVLYSINLDVFSIAIEFLTTNDLDSSLVWPKNR